MPQNVLETDQQRELQSPALCLFDDVVDLDARASFLQRAGDNAPSLVDVEVLRAPALDVIQVARGLNVPAVIRVGLVQVHLKTQCDRVALAQCNKRRPVFQSKKSDEALHFSLVTLLSLTKSSACTRHG